MVNSTINISSSELFSSNTVEIHSSSQEVSDSIIGVTMHISDTSDDIVDASLNFNSSGLRLNIYNSQEFNKQASIFFGSLFTGGFNADYMWSLLAGATNEQINASHLTSALSSVNDAIQALGDAFQIHANNYSIHLSTEDRDFLIRLKAIYGGVYNVALDYLILKNPYEGEINITSSQIALYAGWGGFSAFSGVTDIELEFYNLVEGTYPTKSGGEPTMEAFLAGDGTYGYGITTLTVPTEEPEDLIDGEVGLYVGQGGFNSFSNGNVDVDVIVGYYSEGEFYLDSTLQSLAQKSPDIIYVDLLSDRLFRYDETEDEFIILSGGAGLVKGYYNELSDKFYSSYDGTIYSDEITGDENSLFVDLNTNTIYRYDGTDETYIPISSSGDGGTLVRGYRNPSDNLFYKDYEFTEEMPQYTYLLYYDILTRQIYCYNSVSDEFERYHHKVALDYILINTNYSDTISIAQNQAALYIGEGGFTSLQPYAQDKEIYFGYIYNGVFYEEDTHTTVISASADYLYVDLATNTLYIYKDSAYVPVTSSSPSPGGNGIEVGYYYAGIFYAERTGNYGGYSYSSPITPTAGAIYLDRNKGTFYYYNGSSYIQLTDELSLSSGNKITVTALGLNSYRIDHDTSPSITNPQSSALTGITTDGYGHITAVSGIAYADAFTASTLALRNIDGAIRGSYFIVNNSATVTDTIANGTSAVFVSSGGFTSTSVNDNYPVLPDWGTITPTISSDAIYDAYTVYTHVNSLENRIYVLEQAGGSGGGQGGTTDHNDLLFRFSSEFSGTVSYQHDIGVIQGLQTALDNLSKGTVWSAVAPVVLTKAATSPYSNVISLSELIIPELATYDSGVVLTGLTYTENANARTLTRTTIEYTDSLVNGNGKIVKRKSDGALAATYLIIKDALDTIPVPSTNEAAIYIGTGGFDSTSAGTSYTVLDTFPTTQPSASTDILISARALYDKISTISGGSGTSYSQGNGITITTSPATISANLKANKGLTFVDGGIAINTDSSSTIAASSLSVSSTANRNYKVLLTTDGVPFVNVPWISYTGDSYIGVNNSTGAISLTTSALTSYVESLDASNRTYGVRLGTGGLCVYVPWSGGGSSYTQGTGIIISGNQISVNLGYSTSGKNIAVSNNNGLYVDLSSFATTSDLNSYVTSSSLATTLNGYVASTYIHTIASGTGSNSSTLYIQT